MRTANVEIRLNVVDTITGRKVDVCLDNSTSDGVPVFSTELELAICEAAEIIGILPFDFCMAMASKLKLESDKFEYRLWSIAGGL